MTPEERYLFDLMGFIVVENVLSTTELSELNMLIDRRDLWNSEEAKRPDRTDANFLNGLAGDLYTWEPPFRRLLAHPRVTPYLDELLGPGFRYDHGYMILMRKGGNAGTWTLHGGATPFDPAQYYAVKNGQLHNGLLVVSYALTDAPPGQGGFACVPGSHKSEFKMPDSLGEYRDPPPPWVINVPWRAGSVVIFTEALRHGTWPWTASTERRSVLFKYSPANSAWAPSYAAPVDEGYSPEQKGVLEPPGVPWVRAVTKVKQRTTTT